MRSLRMLMILVPLSMPLSACLGTSEAENGCDDAMGVLADAQMIYDQVKIAFGEGESTAAALAAAKQVLDLAHIAVPSFCTARPAIPDY